MARCGDGKERESERGGGGELSSRAMWPLDRGLVKGHRCFQRSESGSNKGKGVKC